MDRRLARAAFIALWLASSALPAFAQVQSLETAQARAKAMVAAMTLEEKARQIGNDAPAIPRLGIPEYNWWNEGLHGVARAGIATVFPQAIGMAASWDVARMHKVADIISTEFRAKFVERRKVNGGSGFYEGLTVWSPNINIFRDPRWGRGQETYGEDPHLTGEIATAFIKGLQGDDPTLFKTIATSKHFAVHSGPESTRHQQDFHPSPRDLEDTYLPAFRKTVMEGKVGSIMCAYNAVNGVPACASDLLMGKYLRRDWGFKGFVVSDCGAAANIYREDSLRYEKDPVKAVAKGIGAGMDLICGDYRNNMTTEAENIVAAVKSGAMAQATLDQALTRLFEARIRLGLFDRYETLPYAHITAKDYDTPAHHAVSLDMARASMVLLKNAGNLLPLKSAPARIAVIGPNADSLDALVGNYYGTPSAPVTVLDGLRARFPKAKIDYVQGIGLVGPAEDPVPEAAFCADEACRQKGLYAEHFDGVELAGKPVKTGLDAAPAIAWRSTGMRSSSARWSGWLTAPASGDYSFRFASENGYRVYIDGKPVVEEWGVGDAPSLLSGVIALEKGKRYPIRVEAFQRGQRGEQRLVWHVPGSDATQAVAAARAADIVVFVGGLTSRIEGEEMKVKAEGFAGGDRTSLDLPKPQQQLLEQVHAVGKPVVLVLMNGSALSVNWADKHIPAIVEAWYPGGQGGTAAAELIAGDFSPAGRLPVTFYKSAEQLPPFDSYAMDNRTYRYFKGEVLYPFGHGLSYTRFAYAPLSVPVEGDAAKGLEVSTEVRNAGARAGEEVVQLYLNFPDRPGVPQVALRGFQRIALQPGEAKTVRFTLTPRDLSAVTPEGQRLVMAGQYRVTVGGGQPGTGAAGQSARFMVGADTPVAP